jgi:hypothetical protein
MIVGLGFGEGRTTRITSSVAISAAHTHGCREYSPGSSSDKEHRSENRPLALDGDLVTFRERCHIFAGGFAREIATDV